MVQLPLLCLRHTALALTLCMPLLLPQRRSSMHPTPCKRRPRRLGRLSGVAWQRGRRPCKPRRSSWRQLARRGCSTWPPACRHRVGMWWSGRRVWAVRRAPAWLPRQLASRGGCLPEGQAAPPESLSPLPCLARVLKHFVQPPRVLQIGRHRRRGLRSGAPAATSCNWCASMRSLSREGQPVKVNVG